jgi:hypothetical protein
MSAVVETTRIPVTTAVERAALRTELGRLRQKFLLLTRVRLFGRPREEEKFRVYEYEHGLVREGGAMALEVFRWDEIRTVTQSRTPHFQNSRYTGTTFVYRLTRRDGISFFIEGNFIDPGQNRRAATAPANQHLRWAELGEAATRYVAAEQFASAQSALTIGDRLTFGDIVISLRGVHTEKYGIVPWSRVVEIRVREGRPYLRLIDKSVPLSARPVGRVPNFVLLRALVDTLAKSG